MTLSDCGLTTGVLSKNVDEDLKVFPEKDFYDGDRIVEEDYEDMYRAPRNNTYSLADFVKENYTPPVMVKRPKSVVSLSDDTETSSNLSDDVLETNEWLNDDDENNCFDENKVF